MRATVLVDNEAQGLCESEWGLSILIEHRERATLLDAGASGLFAENARKLGVDLAAVDVAALSHAHYDHSDGFDAFFQVNDAAKLFVAASARENCYDTEDGKLCYIGVSRGRAARHAHRIEYVSRPTEIAPDVWALPHTTPNLAEKGAKAGMFTTEERAPEKPMTKRSTTDEPLDESPTTEGLMAEESTPERPAAESPDPATLRPDDFSHEQSIVVKLDEGVAVFSSCSHCGPDVVMAEVHQFMPNQPIRALIGGFHLYDTPDEEVRTLAGRMKNEGIELAYTGHCTGERAFKILQEELGEDVIKATKSGLRIELDDRIEQA